MLTSRMELAKTAGALALTLAGIGWVFFGIASAATPEQAGRNGLAALAGAASVLLFQRLRSR